MQGDEIRALRRLQREQGPSSHNYNQAAAGLARQRGHGAALAILLWLVWFFN
jgi:hypothetical protein